MTMIREHGFYTVTVSVERRDRQEDDIGELISYGAPYRVNHVLNVVAPSEPIAIAWAMHRQAVNNPELVGVERQQIDGFVQDHIW